MSTEAKMTLWWDSLDQFNYFFHSHILKEIGINVFYTYTSLCHKCQKEFVQLERVHRSANGTEITKIPVICHQGGARI